MLAEHDPGPVLCWCNWRGCQRETLHRVVFSDAELYGTLKWIHVKFVTSWLWWWGVGWGKWLLEETYRPHGFLLQLAPAIRAPLWHRATCSPHHQPSCTTSCICKRENGWIRTFNWSEKKIPQKVGIDWFSTLGSPWFSTCKLARHNRGKQIKQKEAKGIPETCSKTLNERNLCFQFLSIKCNGTKYVANDGG